jgi:hypothetical protein
LTVQKHDLLPCEKRRSRRPRRPNEVFAARQELCCGQPARQIAFAIVSSTGPLAQTPEEVFRRPELGASHWTNSHASSCACSQQCPTAKRHPHRYHWQPASRGGDATPRPRRATILRPSPDTGTGLPNCRCPKVMAPARRTRRHSCRPDSGSSRRNHATAPASTELHRQPSSDSRWSPMRPSPRCSKSPRHQDTKQEFPLFSFRERQAADRTN